MVGGLSNLKVSCLNGLVAVGALITEVFSIPLSIICNSNNIERRWIVGQMLSFVIARTVSTFKGTICDWADSKVTVRKEGVDWANILSCRNRIKVNCWIRSWSSKLI